MRKIFLPPELYLGIEQMDLETKWLLFDAIYRYNLWLEYELDDKLKMIFGFFKPFFDNDIAVHEKFCESRRNNGKKWGRPKASITEIKHNQSNKPREAKEPTKPTEVKWSDIYYTRDILYNILDIEKYKKDYPKKNIDIELDKMLDWYESRWKKIKKPNQAFKNWLRPKKYDLEYIEGVVDKTDDQRITEFLSGKNKFNDKYWFDKYQEVQEMRIKKCLSQPLTLA